MLLTDQKKETDNSILKVEYFNIPFTIMGRTSV